MRFPGIEAVFTNAESDPDCWSMADLRLAGLRIGEAVADRTVVKTMLEQQAETEGLQLLRSIRTKASRQPRREAARDIPDGEYPDEPEVDSMGG